LKPVHLSSVLVLCFYSSRTSREGLKQYIHSPRPLGSQLPSNLKRRIETNASIDNCLAYPCIEPQEKDRNQLGGGLLAPPPPPGNLKRRIETQY